VELDKGCRHPRVDDMSKLSGPK